MSSSLMHDDRSPALAMSLSANPPKRILLVARDHLGDLVNTTGAVASVVERFPEAWIALEAGEGAIGVFDGFAGISEFRPRKQRQGLSGKARYVAALRSERFDLAVILDDSNEKVLLASLAGIPRIVGVHRTKHLKRYTASVPYDPNGHDLFDSLRGVLALLGARQDVRPRLAIRPAQEYKGLANAVLVFVSASSERKRWPVERFVELCGLLGQSGLQPVALSAPSEDRLLEPLAEAGYETMEAPATPLKLASLVAASRLVVTVDSGPAHVAAAVGTPAVVLYGPTPPSRFAPYPGQQRLLHAGLPCDMYQGRCAAKTGGRECDRRCMDAISADQVASAVHALVKEVANCP